MKELILSVNVMVGVSELEGAMGYEVRSEGGIIKGRRRWRRRTEGRRRKRKGKNAKGEEAVGRWNKKWEVNLRRRRVQRGRRKGHVEKRKGKMKERITRRLEGRGRKAVREVMQGGVRDDG